MIEGLFTEMKGGLLSNREMRAIIKNQKIEWCSVRSGVPQGSILAPVMFLVYVNDMTNMSLFADEANLLRKIESKEDCKHLQNDLDNI